MNYDTIHPNLGPEIMKNIWTGYHIRYSHSVFESGYSICMQQRMWRILGVSSSNIIIKLSIFWRLLVVSHKICTWNEIWFIKKQNTRGQSKALWTKWSSVDMKPFSVAEPVSAPSQDLEGKIFSFIKISGQIKILPYLRMVFCKVKQ